MDEERLLARSPKKPAGDSSFSKVLSDVFRSEGVEIIRTPFRAPKVNAFAER